MKVNCPQCEHEFSIKNPVSAAGGAAPKNRGFNSPEARAKALETRKRNKQQAIEEGRL